MMHIFYASHDVEVFDAASSRWVSSYFLLADLDNLRKLPSTLNIHEIEWILYRSRCCVQATSGLTGIISAECQEHTRGLVSVLRSGRYVSIVTLGITGDVYRA